MAKGAFTVSTESKLIVPADETRGELILQHHSGDPLFLGFGEAAVVDEGLALTTADPILRVPSSHLSYGAVYGICDAAESATGGYQGA